MCASGLLTERHSTVHSTQSGRSELSVGKVVINQKLLFKMTTSAAFGRLRRPSAENDNAAIPMRSSCQQARCASGGGNSALRLSNQREIKTVHGRLIKVSVRTCVTPPLLAE